MDHLGKRIEQLAKDKGVKPVELGAKMGLSKNHIYTIYRAEHLNTEILVKAADALGIQLLDFFGEPAPRDRATYEASGVGSMAGKRVSQKNSGVTLAIGGGAAGDADVVEQLNRCNQERESWERERQTLERERESLQLVITTQQQLIAALQK